MSAAKPQTEAKAAAAAKAAAERKAAAEAAERARVEEKARAKVERRAAAEAAANTRAEAREASFHRLRCTRLCQSGVHFGNGFLGCRPATTPPPLSASAAAFARSAALRSAAALVSASVPALGSLRYRLALGRCHGLRGNIRLFSGLAFGLGSGRRVGPCPFGGDRCRLAFGRCPGLRIFHLFGGLALVIHAAHDGAGTAQAPPLQERLAGSRHRNRCNRGRRTDWLSGERPAAASPGVARRRRHLVRRALRRQRADRDHRCSSTLGTAARCRSAGRALPERCSRGTAACCRSAGRTRPEGCSRADADRRGT